MIKSRFLKQTVKIAKFLLVFGEEICWLRYIFVNKKCFYCNKFSIMIYYATLFLKIWPLVMVFQIPGQYVRHTYDPSRLTTLIPSIITVNFFKSLHELPFWVWFFRRTPDGQQGRKGFPHWHHCTPPDTGLNFEFNIYS